MALEPASEPPQGIKFLYRKISRFRHGRILDGADMAVRKDEPITVFPLRVFRTVPELMEIQYGENFREAEGPALMPASGASDHADNVLA